jgi:hypothetical protein
MRVRVRARGNELDRTRPKFSPQLLNQKDSLLLLVTAWPKNLPPIQPHPVQQSAVAERQTLFHPPVALLTSKLMKSDDSGASLAGPLLVDARAGKTQINDQIPTRSGPLAAHGNVLRMQQ